MATSTGNARTPAAAHVAGLLLLCCAVLAHPTSAQGIRSGIPLGSPLACYNDAQCAAGKCYLYTGAKALIPPAGTCGCVANSDCGSALQYCSIDPRGMGPTVACAAKVPNGAPCDTFAAGGLNSSCSSGYCNASSMTCAAVPLPPAPKLPLGSPLPCYNDAQCAAGKCYLYTGPKALIPPAGTCGCVANSDCGSLVKYCSVDPRGMGPTVTCTIKSLIGSPCNMFAVGGASNSCISGYCNTATMTCATMPLAGGR